MVLTQIKGPSFPVEQADKQIIICMVLCVCVCGGGGGGHVPQPPPLYLLPCRHVKIRNACIMRYLRSGMGGGHLVAVMVSMWQLWDVRGCYGVYVATLYTAKNVVLKLHHRC